MENEEEFRVIIAGSREFNDYDLLKEKCLNILSNKINDPKYKVIIVSGNARGADSLGERFASEYNLPLELFPADWDKYGKSAGYRRNKKMASVSNALIAFKVSTAENRGTNNMIELAQKGHLKIRVIMDNTKINKLRNAINDYKIKSRNDSLALAYLKNLVDSFGKIGLELKPYSFWLYYDQDENLIYDRGVIKDKVDENHSMSILDLIYTFRDDIKIYD